jgi:hypothetical protein
MASPFSIFRKNQKLMYALLTIMVMFGFVFLPIMMQTGASRKIVNPPAVKTSKFGDLRESQVATLMRDHRIVLGVLGALGQAAGVPGAEQRAQAELGQPTEEGVVDTWLLARHAAQMGLTVSDKTINNFLQGWTRDSVKPADMQAAFKRSGLSDFQFFNLMRDELAAKQFREMFYYSLMDISPTGRGVFVLTPAERWEYFLRVKQMASIEAAPVPVANYVDRVKDPGDEKLAAFFEENKDREPHPGSPEPGFREPQRVALQWFKADFEKLSAAVTDEEVKQRYEKNKEAYDQMEKKPEVKEEEKASTKDTKDTKEVNKAATGGRDPAEKKESTDGKETKEIKQPEKKKDSNKSSSVERRSPFMFTALREEEKPAEKAATSGSAPAATTPPAATEKKPAEVAKPAEKKPVEEMKPAEEKKPAAKPATPPAAVEKPAQPKGGMAEATKLRIRGEIAREKIQKAFDGLKAQMEQYRGQWSQYEVAMIPQRSKKEGENEGASAEKPLPPPPKLDFEKLAKENGLSTGQTKLMSAWEAQSLEIGISHPVVNENGQFRVNWGTYVCQAAFVSLAKFRPEESMDLSGNFYLFWKTEETKEHVPKFDTPGVRERVLQAWKMIQARPLALKMAESLAADAEKAKKTLKQTFADRPDIKVVMPPEFSWITFGNVPLGSAPNAARLSNISGVDMAGEEFMRAVFSLAKDQSGAALNAPETVAYVIRLTALSPSRDVLWKQFEVDDFSKYAPVAQNDRARINRAWLDEIRSSAGFEWMRKPDQKMESGPRQRDEDY